MPYTSLKPQTVLGHQYRPGDVMDLTGMKPGSIEQLVRWRRIAWDDDAPRPAHDWRAKAGAKVAAELKRKPR